MVPDNAIHKKSHTDLVGKLNEGMYLKYFPHEINFRVE